MQIVNEMNPARLASIFLITGFAAVLLVTWLIPSGLYETPDPQARVQIIQDQQSRWLSFQAVNSLMLLLAAAGFLFLARHLRHGGDSWLATFAAAAFIFGSVAGLIFVYQQTVNTLVAYQGAYAFLENAYYWLALTGLFFFGVSFLKAGLPAWLGYLTAGSAAAYGVFFLLTGAGFITPWLVAFDSLIIALFFLRQ